MVTGGAQTFAFQVKQRNIFHYLKDRKTKMDYEGQKLCENLFYWIIILFGAVGWVKGYIEQDFAYVFYAWGVGMAISLVICVPDWPWFNRHPVKWLESVPDRRVNGNSVASSSN